MPDPISLLDHVAPGHDKFGIIVSDLFQRSVLAIFCFPAVHDRHGHLHISILHLLITQDEIAFQFADSANACRIVPGSCIGINDIFQNRTIVDAVYSGDYIYLINALEKLGVTVKQLGKYKVYKM